MARINANGEMRIQVKSPVIVQGVEINGKGEITLEGESITLVGNKEAFNSILVNSGDVTIKNTLINTQNKRITLNENGRSLTLNGNIETGDQTTQIGNQGDGVLTLNGDRSGGNMLIIRDGKVIVTGILSNTGGGGTQVRDNGVVVSSREQGPTIQQGSYGLALLETGVFRLAADNQIAGYVNFAGGKLDLAGFSNSKPDSKPLVASISVTANSVIDFSNPKPESLAIADVSEKTNWKDGATLQIVGFSQGDSLRFGDNGNALTKAQLDAIKFDGKPAQIDSDGYVTPSP